MHTVWTERADPLAGKGLRMLSHAERHDEAPVNPTVTDGDRSKRNPVYEQMGDPRVTVIGGLYAWYMSAM